ncbi:MAG: 5-formyltetrahydrofolate cyclo-ligase [Rhodospirillaceae bacterium]|nr:MAG: 5-formyltetrahydrofolate cyclo-ligase [Rhodospirillaceae bacterium]
MESQEITDLKSALREVTSKRREWAFALNPDAGCGLAEQFMHAVAISPGLAVSGYWPLEGELDVRPLLEKLRGFGHSIGLPIVVKRGEPLVFREWRDHDDMVEGKFKVLTPPDHAPEVIPEVLLVPLLAFDPNGYRLGYGGGFYDRTLDKLRRRAQLTGHRAPLAVGVAYAAQEVPEVPRGPYDQPLDWIVTERSAFKFT